MSEKNRTVLLVMDVQEGIVDRVKDRDDYLIRVQRTTEAAREAGVPVFYVVVGFRPEFPEVGVCNQSFSAVKANGGKHLIQPQPALDLRPNDIVITKRRVSAFTGSDLEVLLRAHDIDHLVLSGIATSGVVLSTLRQAADLDYRLTVLADLCADSDEEIHRVLIEKVFPRQAQVTTAEAWLASI